MDNGQACQSELPLAVSNALRHLRKQITHFRQGIGWTAIKREQLQLRIQTLEAAVARNLGEQVNQEVLGVLAEAKSLLVDGREPDLCLLSDGVRRTE